MGKCEAMSESNLICQTIAREATSGDFEDMVAIGKVLRNRLALGYYGKSYQEVILSKWQFSCWNDGTYQKERSQEQLEQAAKAFEISAMESDFPATHYYNPEVSGDPSWASSPQMKYLCTIGKHKYYQETR